MFAILSNFFVGSALFPVTSICVGIRLFVHRLAGQNLDTKKEVKFPGFRAACLSGRRFVRLTLIVRFIT
jgi:hypothetical protein